MGVSTDAILAFGFDLGADEDQPLAARFGEEESDDGESFDFEDWVARRAGAVYPEGHSGIDSDEYKAYSAKRDAAFAACPVEMVMHCSYDYPMYFLALRGSKTRAWRGTPSAVNPTPPSDAQVTAMQAFCAEHGIEWQQPGWHIFSMWG